MELRIRIDELATRPAKTKDGRDFEVYVANAGDYKLDLQMTKADREMIDELVELKENDKVLIFKLISRKFDFNGREITVPTGSFLKFE